MNLIYKLIFIVLFVFMVILIGTIWNDLNLSRKIVFGISCAFIIVLLDSFFLAYARVFNLLTLIFFILPEDILLAVFVIKRKIIGQIIFQFDLFMFVIALLGCILLLMFPSTNIYGGRDEGLYFMEGVHIAQTGRLDFERDQFLEDNYEEISGWCELGYLGVYSKYYFGTSDSYGDHEFQFMPLLPVSLAIGYLLGGIPLLIRINGIIGMLSLFVIYCFINDYIGNKYHSLFSCTLILISPAFLWNARATFSETLAQFIMYIALYIFCKAWIDSNIKYYIASGILIGITSIVRIDALVCGIGFLFSIISMFCLDSRKSKYYLCVSLSYILTIILCIIYSYQNTYSYIYEHRKLLIPLIVVQLVLLGIFVLLFLLDKKERYTFINNNLLFSKIFQNCFTWVYWLFILFLMFIRPDINEDSFAIRAVKEFSWYTSVIPIVYLPIGIKYLRVKSLQH